MIFVLFVVSLPKLGVTYKNCVVIIIQNSFTLKKIWCLSKEFNIYYPNLIYTLFDLYNI